MLRCPWYIRVRGMDNNTGEELDEFECSHAWSAALAINIANEVRKSAAAIESLRNETMQQQMRIMMLVAARKSENLLGEQNK